MRPLSYTDPIAQIPLSFTVQGDGAPLVLIHGLSGSLRWWSRNIDALSDSHRVYAVDLAGFGKSRRAGRFRLDRAVVSLANWLDSQGISNASLVGHSMGGLIAARLAAESPKRVDHLVLVDAAFLSLDPGRLRPVRGILSEAYLGQSDLRNLVARDSMRASPLSLGRATIGILTAEWHPLLARITSPTLVIWGENDTVTSRTIGQRIVDEIQDARLVIIPGAGHVPMWDRPEIFNKEVVAFLG